jgi:hypothetical protein
MDAVIDEWTFRYPDTERVDHFYHCRPALLDGESSSPRQFRFPSRASSYGPIFDASDDGRLCCRRPLPLVAGQEDLGLGN